MNVPLEASVLSFDTTMLHLADAERLLLGVGEEVGLPADAVVCTHIVRDERSRYAITVTMPTSVPDGLASALERRLGRRPCAAAAAQARVRDGGRAVVFPGQAALRGVMPVADVLAHSAIDRLDLLGGLSSSAEEVSDLLLDTRDFLRPLYRDGRLALPVLPAGAGRVAPFEVPDPTPCCGGY